MVAEPSAAKEPAMPRFQWSRSTPATLATAVGLLGFATGAFAADLRAPAPVYKAPPPVALFSWTGFYVGGTVGAAWTKSDVSNNTVNGPIPLYLPADVPGVNALGSPGLSQTTAIFGLKAGYNQQWGSWVLGIEGDISSLRFNRNAFTSGRPFLTFPAGVAAFSTTVDTSWLATIRPRLGYAFDKVLLYATAGAAFGRVKYSNTYLAFSPLGAAFDNEAAASSQDRVGWAAGAGIDYAVTPNFILSGEYLHVDLGSVRATGAVTTQLNVNPTATFNLSANLTSDIVRFGAAYKF